MPTATKFHKIVSIKKLKIVSLKKLIASIFHHHNLTPDLILNDLLIDLDLCHLDYICVLNGKKTKLVSAFCDTLYMAIATWIQSLLSNFVLTFSKSLTI